MATLGLGKYILHSRKLLRKTNFKDTDPTTVQEERAPPLSVFPPSYKDQPPLNYTWQQTHDVSMDTSTAAVVVLSEITWLEHGYRLQPTVSHLRLHRNSYGANPNLSSSIVA